MIEEPGPWIAKERAGGALAYCPACRTYPQTKFGQDETGTIKCGCHQTTAKILEVKNLPSWKEEGPSET